MGVVGAALRGFGKALKKGKKSKSKWVKDKAGTITGVKPMSGKVPWYVGAGGKNPGKRKDIVITHSKVKKTEEIAKHQKSIKEGKEGLKKMVDTGRAEEMKNYKGKGTGKYFRTGSK